MKKKNVKQLAALCLAALVLTACPSSGGGGGEASIAVTGISLDMSTLELEAGLEQTLTAIVQPADASNKTVRWQSVNTAVATVADGTVKAVAKGETKIIAVTTADSRFSAACDITVKAAAARVDGVRLDKEATALARAGTLKLIATINPANAANKNVTWKSDNLSIAKVAQDGTVTALAVGIAKITVTTEEGGFEASCTVNVVDEKTTVEITTVEGLRDYLKSLFSILAAPVKLRLDLDIYWQPILTVLKEVGKYVKLDLSDCTGMTLFNPGSANTGEKYIVSLVLPDKSTATAGNDVTLTIFRFFDQLKEIAGKGIKTLEERSFAELYGLQRYNFPSLETIGSYAFADCRFMTGNLTIPDSVTHIGDHAFDDCFSLNGNLTIPNSVTSIGEHAFAGCGGLTGNLTIPNSVTHIEDFAFAYCGGLTSVTIPNSVTSIGNNAFAYCIGLTGNLAIPDSVTSIGKSAFEKCSGLTGNLTIPDSITHIEDFAFAYCGGLTGNLTIPNSVTSIGGCAFYGCRGLTGNLIIPNGVTSIDSGAFYGCSGLTGNLAIPNGVTSIGSGAFAYCSGLTSVTIPNSVTSIENDAFEDCSGLTSVTIPNSVTSIGEYVFYGCSGLTSVTFNGAILTEKFANNAFYNMGDLRDRYLSFAGGIGTYVRDNGDDMTWTKKQ